LQRFLDVLGGIEDTAELRLVDDSLQMTDKVRELSSHGSIDGYGDSPLDESGDGDIGQSYAFAHEESACSKMSIKALQGL
jgi:hypothetical protein